MNATQVPTSPRRRRARHLLVTGALLLGACSDAPVRPPPLHDRAAVSALLDAVARARAATFTAEGRFVRKVDGEVVVNDRVVVVQRPPDRMSFGFGSWDGVVAGRGLSCTRQGRHGAWGPCTAAPQARPIDEPADEEAALARSVEGTIPPYRVVRGSVRGCFAMTLRAGAQAHPRWGDRTEMCFDVRTGARSRLRVERPGATDLTELDARPEVAPGDLPEPLHSEAQVPMKNP